MAPMTSIGSQRAVEHPVARVAALAGTALLFVALLAACAPRAQDPGPDPGAVPLATPDDEAALQDTLSAGEMLERRPRLIGCAGYQAPPFGVGRVHSVRLTFVVRDDGSVDPTTISTRRLPRNRNTAHRWRTMARETAEHCVYRPALEDGEPVASRTRLVLRFFEMGDG